VLAAIAIGAAGCSSESLRFNDTPTASQGTPSETTGSVPASRRAAVGRVETSSLPPPAGSQSGVYTGASGTAGGGKGLASYHPGPSARPETTGSVQAPRKPAENQWTWDGGTAVTVAKGETIDGIARRHNVPSSAVLQANNLSAGQAIRPGQRLVIPRYNTAAAPAVHSAPKAVPHTAGANGLGVHIVASGETLTKISHIYKKSLVELAKVNKIQPHAKLNIGDKIIIPGIRTTNAKPKDAPKVADAKPLGSPAPKLAAAPPKAQPVRQAAVTNEPTQSASVVTPANETPAASTGAAKSAEGGPPSFRWPVKARVIAGFGPRTNGQQNDGINLAVPEGTAVKAAEDGIVAYAGNELKGYGNLVLVRHSNGYVTAYAHAKELMVKRGDTIKRGQVIAKSGQTGNVDAPQLHFEIRKGPAPVDPMPMLSGG